MSTPERRWGRHRAPARGARPGPPPVPTAMVPVPLAPELSAQVAVAQQVPGGDPPTLPTGPLPVDDAARRRRRLEEAVRRLRVSESRLTDQIRAAQAQGRTDGMRELLSRRLAVRARLQEALATPRA